MENKFTIFTPAKLNLHLNVLDTHPQMHSYHSIRSIMTKIALYDQLDIIIKKNTKPSYTLVGFNISLREDILFKAYKLFMRLIRRSFSLHITLKKKIPQQAGLGGGSSNAAGILHFLNSFFNHPISLEALSEASKVLGADIPFFIHNYSAAIVEGIGEKITALTSSRTKFLLIKTHESISTVTAFKELDAYRSRQKNSHSLSKKELTSIWKSNISIQTKYFFNDFLSIITPKTHPETTQVLKNLQTYPKTEWINISGTGSTIFVHFSTDADYTLMHNRYKSLGYFSTITETLS